MRQVGRTILEWGPDISLAMLVHQGSYQRLTIAGIRLSYFIFMACLLLVAVAYHKHVRVPGTSRVEKAIYVTLLPMGLFTVLYLASSSWSAVPLFGAARAIKAIMVAALAVLAGRVMVAQPQRLIRLIYSVMAIGIFFLVAGLISCTLRGWENSLPGAFGVRAGILGKSVGLAGICTLGLLFAVREEGTRSLWRALALALLLALIVYGALASGSRSLLATSGGVGAGLIAYLATTRRELRWHCAVACASAILGSVVFFATAPPYSKAMRTYRNLYYALSGGSFSQAMEEARRRSPLYADEWGIEDDYQDYFEAAGDGPTWLQLFGLKHGRSAKRGYGKQGRGIAADLSLRERLGLAHAALTLFREHWPIGVGAGGYSAAVGWRVAHNAILEVMAETGAVGFILVAMWVGQLMLLPLRPSETRRRAGTWTTWNIIWLMLVFGVLHAQFGTFFDENRLLFLLAPVLLLSAERKHHA